MDSFLEVSYMIGSIGVFYALIAFAVYGIRYAIRKFEIPNFLEDASLIVVLVSVAILAAYILFSVVYFIYKII